MQIINKPINLPKPNSVSFNNPQETKANSSDINNRSFDNTRLSFMDKKTNAALRALTFAGKPEEYKIISKFQVPFHNDGHVYELNNGQKVIIIPKPGPTVITTYVKTGSMNEPDGLNGISHYIEHSLYNGSRNLEPNQFIRDLVKIGADNNAATCHEKTYYHVSTSGKDNQTLDKIIEVHAEMVQHPTFTPKQVEKEKPIVISEIHDEKDNPYGEAFNKTINNLFGFKYPFDGDAILGSAKNIKNLTSEKVFDYYNKWYTPENMTTVIVGDVKPNQAIKIVAKHFDKPAPKVDSENKFYRQLNPTQKAVREDISNPLINTPAVFIAFAGPKNSEIKETIEACALTTLLSGYRGTKLNKALKPLGTEPFLAVQTVSPKLNDPQMIVMETTFQPGDEEKGLEIIKQNIRDTAEKPPSEKEMEIIKNKLIDNLTRKSELSEYMTEMVGEAVVQHGNISHYKDQLEIINNLTPQNLQNAAKKYLDLNKVSIVVAHPEKDQEEEATKTNVVSFTGRTKGNSIGKVTAQDLSNNVHLFLNDSPDAIMTSCHLSFSLDKFPEPMPGTIHILEEMMIGSTQKHNEDEIDEIIDVNCLNIQPFLSNSSIGIKFDCIDKKFPLALDVAKEFILNPSLTKEKMDEAREKVKLALMNNQKSASDRSLEELFPDHPMKNTSRLVMENIDNVTLDDVKGFYNQIMTNCKVKAVITGQLSKDSGELKAKILDSLEKDIPKVRKFVLPQKELSAPLNASKVITEADDRSQAHIVQVFKINETGNIKDHAALDVANTILGGGMNSRLFMDLREKKKLAYEIGSRFASNNSVGYFAMFIKTTTKDEKNGTLVPKYTNLQKSIDGFKKHINLLINKKVPDGELNEAKKYIIDAMGSEMESSLNKTMIVSTGVNTKYGPNYTKKYIKAIEDVTAEDIQKVSKMYLTKPSVISVLASQDTLDNSKDYLKSFGEIKEY